MSASISLPSTASGAPAPARPSTPVQLAWARFRRNRFGVIGAVIVFLFVFVGLAAPIISPYRYDKTNVLQANKPPGSIPGHLLGTDNVGRDMLTRLFWGARTSLTVAAGVQLVTLGIALTLGFLAGWFGGTVDFVVSRIIEIFTAIPALFFQIFVIIVLGGGIINVILAIALLGWVELARLVRAQVYSWKEREFVEAARSLGVDTVTIAVRHILPNISNSIIIAITFSLPATILAEAGLSFLGFGINDPHASWGKMVGVSVQYFNRLTQFWHLALLPSAILSFVMVGFSFFGDALRDALDPRSGRGS